MSCWNEMQPATPKNVNVLLFVSIPGKTLAYAVPVIHSLQTIKPQIGVRTFSVNFELYIVMS